MHATGRRANLAGGARERVEGKIGGQRQQRDHGKRQDLFFFYFFFLKLVFLKLRYCEADLAWVMEVVV